MSLTPRPEAKVPVANALLEGHDSQTAKPQSWAGDLGDGNKDSFFGPIIDLTSQGFARQIPAETANYAATDAANYCSKRRCHCAYRCSTRAHDLTSHPSSCPCDGNLRGAAQRFTGLDY